MGERKVETMSEWSTTANMCTGMLSAWMKLYDPILGGVVKATRPPMAMPEQVNPNKANLASSLAQTTGHLSPNELTGMSLTWQQSIGQRIMRTYSYKFIGQGNPMMGKPGSGLETQLQWSGGKHTHLGPAYQLVVGPFNVHSMMKLKLDQRLREQLGHEHLGNFHGNIFFYGQTGSSPPFQIQIARAMPWRINRWLEKWPISSRI